MTTSSTLYKEYLQKVHKCEQLSAKHKVLFEINNTLRDLLNQPKGIVHERLPKIKHELMHLLEESPSSIDVELPLLKNLVWHEILKTSWHLTTANKHHVDHLERYLEPIDQLTQQQLEERERQTTIEFKPLRSYFPERRQASIKRNNPFDLVQATYGDERHYAYINRMALQPSDVNTPLPLAQKEVHLQKAIIYTPINLEHIPLAIRHKLGKHNEFNTHKQLLTHVTIDTLHDDLHYFKEVLATSEPLQRLGSKATRRVQLCTHPDHAGKIFVYRTTTTLHPEGKKTPLMHKSMAIYDDVLSFLRSQNYATIGAKKDLEEWDNLLHTLHTLRINIKNKDTLPSETTLEKISVLLSEKKNHHLAKIVNNYLQKLAHERHPERARNLLWGAENALLGRIEDQESIQNHLLTQKQQMNRMRDFADVNRKRFGSEFRRRMQTSRNGTTQKSLHEIISVYRTHAQRWRFAPYYRFAKDLERILLKKEFDHTKKNEPLDDDLIRSIDTMLSLHALVYVLTRRYHQYRKSTTEHVSFPYQKRLAGTQGYIASSYWQESAPLFAQATYHLEQIELLLAYPSESENQQEEDDNELSPWAFLSIHRRNNAIKQHLWAITKIDLLEDLTKLPNQSVV